MSDLHDIKHFIQSIESSQRARLLQGTQSLNETSNSLARIHTVAAETDEIGTEIITELGMQRETLVRTKDRVSISHILPRSLSPSLSVSVIHAHIPKCSTHLNTILIN